MKGLAGGPCWWEAWGPGPLPPPLNPALKSRAFCNLAEIHVCQIELDERREAVHRTFASLRARRTSAPRGRFRHRVAALHGRSGTTRADRRTRPRRSTARSSRRGACLHGTTTGRGQTPRPDGWHARGTVGLGSGRTAPLA